MKKGFIFCSLFVIGFVLTVFVAFSSREHTKFESFQKQIAVEGENLSGNSENVLQKQQIAGNYGNLPLIFEPNLGQTDDEVKFVSRGRGYGLFLTGNEAVLSLQKPKKDDSAKNAVVKMRIEDANQMANAVGLDETEGKSNYFIGNDPNRWRTNVSNFKRVKYESVYSGVDLVYYGNGRELEYDFIVAPQVNPNQIKLRFDGISGARIEKETGDLLLETEVGTIRQHKPVSYQTIDGAKREIASNYKLEKAMDKGFNISFTLGEYDKSKELVIDPILVYGSYLGGNLFDEGRSIAVDADGNAYVVGTSASLNFPTTAGTIKPTALASTNNQYWYDAFVTKVNPAGTALVFSTYFGGRNGSETGSGVAIDQNGNVLISGTTMANDLPTVNAYQTAFGGTDDAFAAKLNPSGSAIIYSTYLGGNNTDTGGKIAVNQATGDAVFAGFASSPNFPTTPGAYKQKLCDSPVNCSGIFYSGSYVVKLSATGSAIYSTLFDMGINDVALDASDNATVGGTAGAIPSTAGAFQPVTSGGIEGFIAKLNPSGNQLVYGTFLGGGLQSDRVNSIAIDSTGSIYATGQTQNTAFPTTAGAFDQTYNGGEDGFVTKFNPAGSALVFSTFLGGTAKDQPFGIALGTDNSPFIAGETLSSSTFPLKNSINGTNGSIFITHLNSDATALVYSSLLGVGGAYDVAVDSANGAYATGHTTSIVATPNAFQPMKGEATSTSSAKDAFVIKLAPTDETVQTYNISGTVTDPTQFGNYQPIVVTVTGTVSRSIILPYGSGSGVIPYFFGSLPAGGNYTVKVSKLGFTVEPESVVFNNLGANQFADFTIQPNQKPQGVITSPAHGTTYNAPATINITATASDPDGDAITKVDFVAYSSETGNINLGTDTTAPYEFTWTNVPVGTWSLAAYPTDSKGLRGDSTPIVHVFVVDATGLSVSITSPTNGQTFTEGDYIPLSANVSSSTSVLEFYDQNNTLIGRRTSAPWSTTWRVFQVGNYTITAKVFNSQGNSAISTPINIAVNPINHRISGRITDSITNNPLSGVTLNLTVPNNPSIMRTTTTDSSGSYLFTDLGTTPNDSAIITPVSSVYSFTPTSIGTGFLGYITDWTNQNFTATAQTQISVALTSPTEGQTFTAPATINLAANASSGAGAITKVEFFRRRGAIVTLVGTDTTAPFEFQDANVAANSYEYFARATDSTNAVTDSAEVNVTVNAAPLAIRLQGDITNPGGGPMIGVTLNLTGTANGNPVNQTATSNTNGAYGFFNIPAGGTYTITPQVVGGVTFTPPSASFTNVTQDTFDINFVSSAVNQPPTVQINSPADGAIYTTANAIPFNVTASDADGQIVHLTVTAISQTQAYTVGQSLNGTFVAPWQPPVPGSYTIWAVAVDNGGLRTTVSIRITVNPPSPVLISGRIVDRNSVGIEGVTLELKNYPQEENVVATVLTDANGNYAIPNLATFSSYILRASKQDYAFSPRQRIYFNVSTAQTNADFTGTLQVQPSDFDGDRQTDVAVWRPETGVWHILRSNNNSYTGIQFGAASFGDVPVPGNYDGDSKIDIAVFRSGTWFILNSSNNQVRGVQFGAATDKPMPGDYDGDGKTDIAVFRPSNGYWYILRSSDNQVSAISWGFGTDVPLVGDFDGDGFADITVYRPSNGTWYIRQSSDGNLKTAQFGASDDVPLIGDFDGDKRADITVFRPSNGIWYSLRSSDNAFKYFQWGGAGDTPVAGDYDHDGKTDYAVFRKAEGNWYAMRSSDNAFIAQPFGANGDMPIPAASIR